MNIINFRSSFANTELSRPALFSVAINAPGKLKQKLGDSVGFMDRITARCRATGIPSRTLETVPYNDYGAPRKVVHGALYEPINLEFIMSSDSKEYLFFNAWHQIIVDTGTSFDVEYYDNYIADIIITQLDKSNRAVMKHTLREAYPISVQSLSLNWDDTNSYLKLNVQINFRFFYTDYIKNGVSSIKLGDYVVNTLTPLSSINAAVPQQLIELQKLGTVAANAQSQVAQAINFIKTTTNTVKTTVNQVKDVITIVRNDIAIINDQIVAPINQAIRDVRTSIAAINTTVTAVQNTVRAINNASISDIGKIADSVNNTISLINSDIEFSNNALDAGVQKIETISNTVNKITQFPGG